MKRMRIGKVRCEQRSNKLLGPIILRSDRRIVTN